MRIGRGAYTIQQCLRAGFIAELYCTSSLALLEGEQLFEGINVRALRYVCGQFVTSDKSTHNVFRQEGHNDT